MLVYLIFEITGLNNGNRAYETKDQSNEYAYIELGVGVVAGKPALLSILRGDARLEWVRDLP